MELYFQDKNFKVTGVIDQVQSLIWTDKYSESGDVSFSLNDAAEHREILSNSVYVSSSFSEHTMILETFSIKDGVIKVIGPSLESILNRRIVAGTSPVANTNLFTEIINLVQYNIGGLAVLPERRVTNFNIDSTVPADYVDPNLLPKFPQGENLYDVVSAYCAYVNLGFQITNDPGFPGYTFKLIYGRTTRWRTLLFSLSFGNIGEPERLQSTKDMKNLAVVNLPPANNAPGEGEKRRVTNDPELPTGIDRREVWIDADDLRRDASFNDANKYARMDLLGRNSLLDYRPVDMYDFSATQDTTIKFGVDYFMGDLVGVIDENSDIIPYRVTAYTHAFDKNFNQTGYPTLKKVDV